MKTFETTVPGKWVLTGEHAVLRGADAVALPHPEYRLNLQFMPAEGKDQFFRVESHGPMGNCGLGVLLENWIDDIFVSQGRSPNEIEPGVLKIQSSIPLGGGLGSSAALCVALTRWLGPKLGVAESQYQQFATGLEDRFHVRSSGMDVAVCTLEKPILYSRPAGPRPIHIKSLPKFTFHDTGHRSATRTAVERVKALAERNPTLARQLDDQMADASRHASRGLERGDTQELARAMDLAQECFDRWDIVPEAARDVMNECRSRGALSVKLTGGGLGGFVVALWG